MKMNLDIADEFLSRIEQLVDDLNSKSMSSYGKEILTDQLNKCVKACRESFRNITNVALYLESKCKSLEKEITQPQNRENEFKDIAKKLNFPISSATTDGLSKNPNVETPFENSVPKKDIKFIKKYLQQDKELGKDIVVPKDERLTEKEIAAYTSIDKAFAEDRKIEKKLLKEVKKLSKKTEKDKDSNKKAKSKKQKA